MRHKKLPYIPVQPADQEPEFARSPYTMNDAYNENNSRMYKIFRDTILRLLYSNFKWYGLTDQEAQAVEYYLINDGRVCAVKSEFDLDTQSPDAVLYGRFGTDTDTVLYDFYGNPLSASCSGWNGEVYRANDPDHFVIGFDTCANHRTHAQIPPIISYVDTLAYLLDRAYQAWQVASETRKLGMVFQCSSDKSKRILEDTLRKLSSNKPYVVIEGNINEDTEQILAHSGGTDGISEYHMQFMNTWGCVMDLLGLENNSQNKRERLVVTEAEMNRSLSRYIGADRLRARKMLAEALSDKFGISIQVENYLASMVIEEGNEANEYGTGGDMNDADETDDI